MTDLVVAGSAVVLSACASTHLLSVGIAMVRQGRSRPVAPQPTCDANLTIIRPLCGIEPFSEECLRSTFAIEHSAAEIIFCVAHGADPVVPMVERLIGEHPERRARLFIGQDRISTNPKLNNLVKGWNAAGPGWIAFVDSNVVLPPDAFSQLLHRLAPTTGMLCSPPVGTRPQGFAARLESTFLNSYQARWQSTADAMGQGFAQGKVMLFRREVLENLGGLEALGAEPAEDAAATRLLRANGLSVRLVDRFFEQPLGKRTLASVWQRQVRWARLRRASFPFQYALEILTGFALPLLACLSLCSAAGMPAMPATLALAALWYGAEAMLAITAGWPSAIAAGVIRDALLPFVWAQGWLSRDIEWQGHSFKAERSSAASHVHLA